MRTRTVLNLLALYALLTACGGGGSGGSTGSGNVPPPGGGNQTPRFTIGGQVVGLRGSGLQLQIGQGETLAVQAGGAFVFPTALADGTRYDVRVIAQPTNLSQVCGVNNGAGTLAGANVTGILVACSTSMFRLGGTLAGLRGTGLSLRMQPFAGQQPLDTQFAAPTADGHFEFPNSLDDGTTYEIRIDVQPLNPRQICNLANGSGTVTGNNIDSASITCTTPTFTLSGTMSGLHGQGLVLTNNGTDPVTVSSNGPFIFPTPLFDFVPWNVQVSTHPSNLKQTCTVINSTGFIAAADVSIVRVECTATQQLGSSGDDEALAAAVDPSSNLLVAGRTTGSLDGAANAGGWDGFLFKFDFGGGMRWKRQLRSPGDDTIEALDVGGTGDIYIAGSTSGSLDGTNAGGSDAFVAKYDRDGNVQWIRQLGTGAADVVHGIDVFSDGSVYIVGETRGPLDGNPVAGEADLFVARLDASGSVLWLRQLGSSASDVAFAVSVDAVGTAHLAGGTGGNLDGVINDSGGEAGFIVKYDAMGTRLVTRLPCKARCSLPGGLETGVRSRFNAIATGVSGESYVAGWLWDPALPQFNDKHSFDANVLSDGFMPWYQTRGSVGGDAEVSDIVLGKGDGLLYMAGNNAKDVLNVPSAVALRVPPLNLGGELPNDIGIHVRADAFAITTDVLSNAYVVGRTFGSLQGNTHLGGTDIFIVRYNEAWQQQ